MRARLALVVLAAVTAGVGLLVGCMTPDCEMEPRGSPARWVPIASVDAGPDVSWIDADAQPPCEIYCEAGASGCYRDLADRDAIVVCEFPGVVCAM
jgi:hypothetical protein